jgi:uncharacterized protein YggE
MKKLSLSLILILFAKFSFAQVSGNINYQQQTNYPENNININWPRTADVLVSVKGLANVKADTYVAIFAVSQVGKTTEEVNRLLDDRINQATSKLKTKPGTEVYVDMVSFVPVYEYQVEKKIFSKDTYNEIPAGFELRKNIHIKYSDPNYLNEIIATLSQAEIYDLVRVDYFSTQLESIKNELRKKASAIVQAKLDNYETLLGTDLDTLEKQVLDQYKVVLPVERYESYQAYNSTSLNLRKPANVNQTQKQTTLYYQPIIDKEFDFVVNPVVFEPVIQVMYEKKIVVKREKEQAQKAKAGKKYILITPNGELRNLDFN